MTVRPMSFLPCPKCWKPLLYRQPRDKRRRLEVVCEAGHQFKMNKLGELEHA